MLVMRMTNRHNNSTGMGRPTGLHSGRELGIQFGGSGNCCYDKRGVQTLGFSAVQRCRNRSRPHASSGQCSRPRCARRRRRGTTCRARCRTVVDRANAAPSDRMCPPPPPPTPASLQRSPSIPPWTSVLLKTRRSRSAMK